MVWVSPEAGYCIRNRKPKMCVCARVRICDATHQFSFKEIEKEKIRRV